MEVYAVVATARARSGRGVLESTCDARLDHGGRVLASDPAHGSVRPALLRQRREESKGRRTARRGVGRATGRHGQGRGVQEHGDGEGTTTKRARRRRATTARRRRRRSRPCRGPRGRRPRRGPASYSGRGIEDGAPMAARPSILISATSLTEATPHSR